MRMATPTHSCYIMRGLYACFSLEQWWAAQGIQCRVPGSKQIGAVCRHELCGDTDILKALRALTVVRKQSAKHVLCNEWRQTINSQRQARQRTRAEAEVIGIDEGAPIALAVHHAEIDGVTRAPCLARSRRHGSFRDRVPRRHPCRLKTRRGIINKLHRHDFFQFLSVQCSCYEGWSISSRCLS